MARLFSFRKSKVANEHQKGQSTTKMRPIKQLLNKTKNLFRHSRVPEPTHPFQPPAILPLPETTGSLQELIDEGLLLLSEGTTISHAGFSSSTRCEGHTSSAITCRDGLTHSPLLSAGSTGSDAHEESLAQAKSSSDSKTLLSGKAVEAWPENESLGGSQQSSVDGSPAASSSLCAATAETSVLELVHCTPSKTQICLSSSKKLSRPKGPGGIEGPVGETHPSLSTNHVPEEDLRQTRLETPVVLTYSPQPEPNSGELGDNRIHRSAPVQQPQLLTDVADASFFDNILADESDFGCIRRMFTEAELLEVAASSTSSIESNQEALNTTERPEFICFAQSELEIDAIRRCRSQFARSLEVALAEQKTGLECGFEESYDSSAKLHEIEMLNAQDDHDAEVHELKQSEKDLRGRLADKGKTLRLVRADMETLKKQCNNTVTQLEEKSSQCDQVLQALQERETILQRQNEDLYRLRDELAKTRQAYQLFLQASRAEDAENERSRTSLEERYNGLLTGFNQLNANRQVTEGQLEATRRQLQLTQAALKKQQEAFEQTKASHELVIAKKVRDFSWHIEQNVNAQAMRPLSMEDEIAKVTAQLRKTLEEQIELSVALGSQLESTQVANKAKFKKLKRVIANQGQENVILEMALSMAQRQRDHWAEQYDEVAHTLASKLPFSSFARSLAERHIALQETRFALEAQLLEAKLRGDRALLDREIVKRHEAIKLGKRDAEIASLKHQLGIVQQDLDNENGKVLIYQTAVDEEMPGLQARNKEVERMLDDQVTNNIHADHRRVVQDLRYRLRELEETNKFWEHSLAELSQEFSRVKSDWENSGCIIFSNLTNARTWRNDRDRLEIENAAFRERFADELVNEPLVIPADWKTRQQIEDDFKLENIDDALLKQFGFTFGSVPKEVLGLGSPPWEHILVKANEDIAKQKQRWIAKRDALKASFEGRDPRMPNNHECIDSDSEFEVEWKGKAKAKATGRAKGNDGQPSGIETRAENEKARGQLLIAAPDPSETDPTAEFF
ncbi:hypothetical protein EPUS_06761 [Endocarpon pusillum Z07020]|uniref:Uncharacterized protein n=1 Tax=Endocarpon pusillum (strain Z07020 / HMAS-L-300199) TaxID=1263415 RepID=U1G9H0_ENDPU|nr:uncharacterized protein EPUS_06761 [Endocarpon pusillum Z07020]ERF68346.1 hypothetical protein EPUS_06761 [Endocarpon pusillum Z07020]